VPIAAATFGRVQDYQVRDINNMGAAMAPAAASTLLHYFADTHTEPQEFDCIYTGDLGQVGSSLLRELLAAEGLLVKNHVDCGCILFDAAEQQVKSGGSGPGCCAAVLCGHILPRLLCRSQKRVLFVATGALMSQTTFLQKESIPAVAHLVELRAPEKESGA
jgi:stage V sporulation protein AD